MMPAWFVLTVFGKIVLTAGPLHPAGCTMMLRIYEPPTLTDVIVADGKIVKPSDFTPWCIVAPFPPPLGRFEQGSPT